MVSRRLQDQGIRQGQRILYICADGLALASFSFKIKSKYYLGIFVHGMASYIFDHPNKFIYLNLN